MWLLLIQNLKEKMFYQIYRDGHYNDLEFSQNLV